MNNDEQISAANCMDACPCQTTACQYVDFSIPVELKPNAVIGRIRTDCCGRPVITCKENHFLKNCEITIEQKIRIRIPIKYSASAQIGDVTIDCCEEMEK